MHPSQIATICHAANAAYAIAIGNPVAVPPWDEAPENVRAGTIAGVELYLSNPNLTPAEMHANWAATRKADGWVYGPEKDYALRTHPNLVDNYEDLPEAERRKDDLFAAIIRALTAAPPEAGKEPKKKGKGEKPEAAKD